MPDAGERLATLEAGYREVKDDMAELRSQVKEYHHRLRTVEAAATNLVEAQRAANRLQEQRQRSIERRFQWLTLVIALAGVVGPGSAGSMQRGKPHLETRLMPIEIKVEPG